MPLWPLSSSCPLERYTYSNGLIAAGVHFEEVLRNEIKGVERLPEKSGCERIRCHFVAKAAGRISPARRWLKYVASVFLALAECLPGGGGGGCLCMSTMLRWAKTPQNSAHMLPPLSLPSSTRRLGQSTQSVPSSSLDTGLLLKYACVQLSLHCNNSAALQTAPV